MSGQSTWTTIKRGLSLKCPNCGQGRLMKTYLRQVDNCAVCTEGFGHIRADDAPPWLTILIVGHIIAPLMLTFETYKSMPFWQEMAGMIALALLLIFLILPRAKGFFLALLWAQKRKTA